MQYVLIVKVTLNSLHNNLMLEIVKAYGIIPILHKIGLCLSNGICYHRNFSGVSVYILGYNYFEKHLCMNLIQIELDTDLYNLDSH